MKTFLGYSPKELCRGDKVKYTDDYKKSNIRLHSEIADTIDAL